jgi:DNA-binding PadR family transcriptional regulator
MAERKVGNLLALAVLSYLTPRPMHPYELGRILREHGDERSIKFNHGSLYMVCPERTVYALTDAGRQEFHEWLRELLEEPRHEYPQFVAALSLVAALPPDDVVELLATRRRRLAEQRAVAAELVENTVAAGVHPLFLVEEEYRLALLDAEAAFVDDFVARITDPQTGWGPQWAAFHNQQGEQA